MAQVDLSGIEYFVPLIGFILVFVIIYAVLNKTKVFENLWLELFISFLVSTLFISVIGPLEYIQAITPWFAILLVSLFFILVLTGFVGDKDDALKKLIGQVFVYILLLVFLVAAFFVFSSMITPYIPGSAYYGSGANKDFLKLISWTYESKTAGAFWLILVSALASWILVRSSKKK
jgi:hypothetical protein